MAKGLVIVESPTKAKTIEKYLGKGYTVEALARACQLAILPKSTLGVDIENDFETEYVVIPGKEKVIARLKKLAVGMDTIYLARLTRIAKAKQLPPIWRKNSATARRRKRKKATKTGMKDSAE